MISEKLLSVLIRITALNGIVWLLSVGSIAAIGETVPWKELNLLHLAYFLLQLELSAICFGISAFVRRGSLGIGLGVAVIMYFLNLIANITEKASFLKYVTPFGYCSGADLVANGSIDPAMAAIGILIGTAGVIAAYLKYTKKDIH